MTGCRQKGLRDNPPSAFPNRIVEPPRSGWQDSIRLDPGEQIPQPDVGGIGG